MKECEERVERLLDKLRYPEDLPITGKVEEIREAIHRNRVIVVAGETGSGKTTQLPKIALEAGCGKFGLIGCTQPRRVAALTVSRRIAEELQTPWGKGVGAKIRFTEKTSAETVIKVMTDGILLNEIEHDPYLSRYGAIILDEAHERSLNIDFLMGHLKRLLTRRKNLRVIITSATIDTEAFSKAFDGAPIIQVSGRTYPVDTIYAPLDELLEDAGDYTYIEGVGEAIQRILDWNRPGDVLVFLPGERDIRDARQLLEGRHGNQLEVLPLFGRLSNQDQEKIFQTTRRRKVVLSTNIAETSLTIPGIRYVVDVGLARVSRYSPQTHTQRLPIERVSQSSADQRKGRAGRMSEGVCIRLYSETDFVARDRYSTPEILRSNLASVILRLKAFHLGEVEDFPFIDPPTPRAIQAGYRQLRQLGALTETNELTAIGKRLAHLPVDPAIGRMLIEANREGCLREILVIASGLSIQDPREVPMEAVDAARTQHRTFQHDESDFMTYLNIWNRFHDEMEKLTQNQLRKFCKAHFLNYLRMREWRDIHSQLEKLLGDSGEVRMNVSEAEYFQIHRALLVGLLSGIAMREEGNTYRAPQNRLVELFPGSTLFNKKLLKRKKGKLVQNTPEKGTQTPPWILAGEWVETQRLYARTVAKIDPSWILELGKHLIETRYSEPAYDEKEARVFVRERKFIFGLPLQTKKVNYLKINAREATEIFIQSALLDGRLSEHFQFLQKNEQLRARVENLQTRVGKVSSWALEEILRKFYSERIEGVGSLLDLQRFIRRRIDGDETQLELTEDGLIQYLNDPNALSHFPEAYQVDDGNSLPIEYAYKPGESEDGATLKIPVRQFSALQADHLIWAVPGFLKDVVECLIRALPKEKRQRLFPIAEAVDWIRDHLDEKGAGLNRQLSTLVQARYGIAIPESEWNWEAVPEYLRPRLEVINDDNEVIATGRQFELVKSEMETLAKTKGDGSEKAALAKIWKEGRLRWEREIEGLDDYPESFEPVLIGSLSGLDIYAHPGIVFQDNAFGLRLFVEEEDARKKSIPNFQRFALKLCSKELTWLERDLEKALQDCYLLGSDLFDKKQFFQSSLAILQRYWFAVNASNSLRRSELIQLIEQAKAKSKGSVFQWCDTLQKILEKRLQLLRQFPEGSAGRVEVNALVGKSFFKQIDFEQLMGIPKFLEAIEIRIKKARVDPKKDLEKVKRLQPYLKAYGDLIQSGKKCQRLRWLIEDFKVQLFAQELGTFGKVSEKILREEIERLR